MTMRHMHAHIPGRRLSVTPVGATRMYPLAFAEGTALTAPKPDPAYLQSAESMCAGGSVE